MKAGLSALDPGAVAAAVKAGQPVAVNGVTLLADEVLVQAMPREGLVVAGEGGIVVGLDTALNESLINEGLAREVVRRINDLRKSAGLNISDRIQTKYEATARLANAIEACADYIKGETLSVDLRNGSAGAHSAQDEFDGETLSLTIDKVA